MSEALKRMKDKRQERGRKKKRAFLTKFSELGAKSGNINKARKEEEKVNRELKAAEKEYIKTLQRDTERAIAFLGAIIEKEKDSRDTYEKSASGFRKLGLTTLADKLESLARIEDKHATELNTLKRDLRAELDKKLLLYKMSHVYK